MILKKIVLDNIRSYEHQELDFNNGSLLLSGDIGSGKTTILLAIEFALFGLQPGQRGSILLRNGQNQGGVSIEFEIDGENILIERTLKKGKTISQDYAAITLNGVKQEFSVTELKSKVLEILNYPKEFSKKQNLLYKFTVYTPQEEMKQIILQDTATRINTLRHIFGIDKYKKIIENSSIIIHKLREEIRRKEGMTSNLEKDKLNLASKTEELIAKDKNLHLLEEELILKVDLKNKVKEELSELSQKINEKLKFQQEIEKVKIMISTKLSSIEENKRLKEQLNSQISESEGISYTQEDFIKLKERIFLLRQDKKELESAILDVKTKINSLNLKNQENESLKEKLKHIEVCPTCLQDVNLNYKTNVLKKLELNTLENSKKIDDLITQRAALSEKIVQSDLQISLKEKKIQELNILKVKLQNIQEKRKRIEDINKSNLFLSKDIDLLNKQISVLKSSILEFSKYDNLFEQKQKSLDKTLEQEKATEIKMAELKKEIFLFSQQIEDLKKKISEGERLKKELHYFIDLNEWISKQFIPLITNMEKNVMNKLKSEFSKLFSEWFSMLVPDDFNVGLDDNFTPVIEFQDYSINYAYLSGGERTAIALAYRLSLNQVLNSMLCDIKTKGLMILDEPTDGFSEQQLDKMRSVLEELNVKQLIIVSHEQKIESFVENVIRFKKENGKSIVE